MVIRALLAVAAAGCYSPALNDGQTCSETAHCPQGLSCDPSTNTCVRHIVHCTKWSDFGAPTTLAVGTPGDSLFTPWLSPDKLELWYTDASLGMPLQRSRRQPGGDFPAGEPVDPQPDDMNQSNGQPFLSDDLLTLYYNDGALHVLQRTRESVMDGFVVTSERLFPNMEGSDPAVTADNLEMVIAFPVHTNAADLWLSTRASVRDEWPLPTPDAFAAANDDNNDDCCATISGDGTEVIFESMRVDGQALWRTTRATRADPFGVAEKLVGQPDRAGNGSPTLSRDGTTLVFSSQPDGQPTLDIVLAERTCLQSD